MTHTHLTKLCVDAIAPPISLFNADGGQDVTLKFEHGWQDSGTFFWMVPNGKYWVIQGADPLHLLITRADVQHGSVTFHRPEAAEVQDAVGGIEMSSPEISTGAHDPMVTIENNVYTPPKDKKGNEGHQQNADLDGKE